MEILSVLGEFPKEGHERDFDYEESFRNSGRGLLEGWEPFSD